MESIMNGMPEAQPGTIRAAATDKESLPPRMVAVASGKGGVGKTLSSLGLGWYLARIGYRVVVVDMDFGVGNLHLSAGIGRIDKSLDHFLSGKVADLNELVVPLEDNPKLSILPAAGRQTSATGIFADARKQLLDNFQTLNADIVLLDIGAGSSQDNIDFFLHADHRLAVATADLSAMTALISFLKKSLIHHILGNAARDFPNLRISGSQEFVRVADLYNAINKYSGEDAGRQLVAQALKSFRPAVILNRVVDGDLAQIERVNKNLMRHLNATTAVLGTIPEDNAITRCRRLGQNFLHRSPESAAAKALAAITSHWQDQYLFNDDEHSREIRL
ncbi:MAG: AAA family ATPase [Proteobacteria bacterium]|nr:AAA family ATPase [Pseudomonadota bacterium]